MNNKEILANAPEGWTHVITGLLGSPEYFKAAKKPFSNVELWTGKRWKEYNSDMIASRSRADIERIVELEEAIKYATSYLASSKLNSIGYKSKAHNELLGARDTSN